MHSNIFNHLIAFCVSFLLILNYSTNADRSCNVFLVEHNRQQAKNLGMCTRILNYKTGIEKVSKSLCIMKCTLERLGLINSNGFIIDKTNLQLYVEKSFPKSLHQHAASRLGLCLSRISTNKLDVTNDPICMQYEPFIKCVTTTYRQICTSEPKKLANDIPDPSSAVRNEQQSTTKGNNQPQNLLHDLFYIAAL